MDAITSLLAFAVFLSLFVLERQNVETKATLKRIEDKIDAKKKEK